METQSRMEKKKTKKSDITNWPPKNQAVNENRVSSNESRQDCKKKIIKSYLIIKIDQILKKYQLNQRIITMHMT